MSSCGIYLALVGLLFVISGGCYLAQPEALLALAGIPLSQPSAVVEVRAYYGGLQLMLGLFLLLAVRQPTLRVSALLCVTVPLFGMALGRVSGLLLAGEFDAYNLGCLALEASLALAGAWQLLKPDRCGSCPEKATCHPDASCEH